MSATVLGWLRDGAKCSIKHVGGSFAIFQCHRDTALAKVATLLSRNGDAMLMAAMLPISRSY